MLNKGVQRHLEGTARVPPPIPTYNLNHQLDKDELDELDKIREKWDMCNQHEASIKAQILTTLPESLAIEIQALDTRSYGMPCVKNTRKGHS